METSATYGKIPVVDTNAGRYTNSSQSADQLRMDFLKLLTAQLEYQDPLDPVENTEFTSQMAQFTGLGEQQKSNQLLEQLVKAQNLGQMNQAVSYIGKMAVVAGDGVAINNGAGRVRFDMPQAGMATINLFDENGVLVKNISAQNFDRGMQSFALNDPTLPNGNYRFAVSMRDAEGNDVAVTTLESGVVRSVINDSTGVTLELNGRRVNLADVRQVEQS
ncbi:MAG: hypothetical protein G8237_03985 [Magnetococcales bacterium]|nr:hypothetical protein [Magnetococcales bacterium]